MKNYEQARDQLQELFTLNMPETLQWNEIALEDIDDDPVVVIYVNEDSDPQQQGEFVLGLLDVMNLNSVIDRVHIRMSNVELQHSKPSIESYLVNL